MRRPGLLIHSDWSSAAVKRRQARAAWDGTRYRLTAPGPVGDVAALLAEALAWKAGPVLAGFDFPIGLPASYGRRTGLPDFRAALGAFGQGTIGQGAIGQGAIGQGAIGQGTWSRWFAVADAPADIALTRPFYPARPGGRSQAQLLAGLGVGTMDDLRRACERPTATRRAANPLFWTLGGNQVGRAAIAGWRDFVIPALAEPGVALWPFDGPLGALLDHARLVVAETYPADAYGQVGLRFSPRMSKRRQDDRRGFAGRIGSWAARRGHALAPDLAAMIADGFGARAEGEDDFDAVLGLCGMLEVACGHRPEGTPPQDDILRWEGWILGQGDTPYREEARP